jgi:hypothetical protein
VKSRSRSCPTRLTLVLNWPELLRARTPWAALRAEVGISKSDLVLAFAEIDPAGDVGTGFRTLIRLPWIPSGGS